MCSHWNFASKDVINKSEQLLLSHGKDFMLCWTSCICIDSDQTCRSLMETGHISQHPCDQLLQVSSKKKFKKWSEIYRFWQMMNMKVAVAAFHFAILWRFCRSPLFIDFIVCHKSCFAHFRTPATTTTKITNNWGTPSYEYFIHINNSTYTGS